MATLSRELRKALACVVTEARDVAEDAADKALKALAVGERDPHRSMTPEQKALRNRLRAHGRQLGDRRNVENGTQDLHHLIAECAYEHWHRMLFARFLAENQLLLEPVSGVAVEIDEVKELARARGQDWVVLAADFAVPMLPQVFRQDDPVLAVQFAPEDRKRLEELLESLPGDVFTASDSLGWTYQFWQAKRKEAINASGEQIGAEELPAVTQLFTEDYMVDFLLDNTLGAWHAGRVLAANPHLAENAGSEEDLRRAVALSGCSWSYLRFIRGADGKWKPAAGTFDGWPNAPKGLKCLDPCMGSGHFVVALLDRLVPLRMAEEKLGEAAAVAAVIGDNLFGLEIDPRCTQIGAFNLALAAWRRIGHCALPAMNLACSGMAPNAKKADWLRLAGSDVRLQSGLERLYELFKDAPVLGSLINPRSGEGDLLVASFSELQPLLEKALAQNTTDDAAHEMAVTARGLAKAAAILADQFTLVATNVPYLGRGDQPDLLREFCDKLYPDSKTDLATAFLERMVQQSDQNASVAVVVPRIWLTYTAYYRPLRKKLLHTQTWNILGVLGKRAFAEIGGEVVDVVLAALSRRVPSEQTQFSIVNGASEPSVSRKMNALKSRKVETSGQANCLAQPGHVVISDGSSLNPTSGKRLIEYATVLEGLSRGDTKRFDRCFWEVSEFDQNTWAPLIESATTRAPYGGCSTLFLWESGVGAMARSEGARVQGLDAWRKRSVFISRTHLNAFLTNGAAHAQNGVAIVPRSEKYLPAIWSYCSSEAYRQEVLKLNQKLIKPTGALDKVPFDLAHWDKVSAEKYPRGLPKPFSSDATQWLFNGHPKGSDQPLQVAVARLLGYQWPRQTGSSFPDCPALGMDGLEVWADSDGIVCLTSLKGEEAAVERLRKLLGTAYGAEWSAARQPELLTQAGFAGKPLDDWLRDAFFEQHCALFHQRPFIWHLWDGERDGFHALVNYHKLAAPNGEGRKTLEKLAYAYLGDWIRRQKADRKQGKEGADAKLAAALHLQERFKKIMEGEPPYDLFVRWKPLHQQPIGWEPDVNDGVRMNIRPFMMAETLKGKSIFRKAPRIKWDRDGGNESERAKRDFPWFWSWDEQTDDFTGGRVFDGNRWTDLHYSNDVKRDARADHNGKKR